MYNPPHPGEILKDLYLDTLHLSVTKAAQGLNVTRKNLSQILNGKTGISPEMAIKLSVAFDTTPTLWLNLQTTYSLWKAQNSIDTKNITCFYKHA